MAGGNPAPGKTGPLDGVDLSSVWKAGQTMAREKSWFTTMNPLGLAAVASSFMTGGQGGFGKDRGGLTAEDMTRRANQR